MRQLPNLITVFRIALVVPTGWCLAYGDYGTALLLMAVAGVSDAIDGALARRYAWTTPFGAFADPLADKLLIGVTFLILLLQGHVPLWVAAIVLARDVVIVGGVMLYSLLIERIDIAPTFISKANTAVQIVMLILLLVQLLNAGTLSTLAAWLVDPWGFALVGLLGIASGLDYVITWSYRAFRTSRSSQ